MPKAPTKTSTNRRKDLATFINRFGDIMPVACRNCRNATPPRVCRVHVRSGRCGECNLHNLSDCNVRISEREWDSIRVEKERVLRDLESIEAERLRIQREELRLQEARLAATQRERQLQEQMKVVDQRAAEAISVEERQIEELERQEAMAFPGSYLALSPFTWSALDGLGDGAWSSSVPSFLEGVGGENAPVTSG